MNYLFDEKKNLEVVESTNCPSTCMKSCSHYCGKGCSGHCDMDCADQCRRGPGMM